jgi:hypothetical protein
LAKKELQKFKQDQLKLKRENKVEETDKPYEVVSFKSENKVSLKKKKIGEKRLRFSNRRKKSIEVESREKKIRMRKEERVENIGKHLSFYTKESEIKSSYFSYMLMILLVYKNACLNTNNLDSFIPSVVISLL